MFWVAYASCCYALSFLHAPVLMNFDLIFQCNLLRDNIMIEELCSGNGVLNPNGSGAAKERDTFSVSKEKTSFIGCSPCGTKFLDDGTLFEEGPVYPGAVISVSRVDWLSLFEEVLQIAMRKTEEIVRVEAVSILNIILIRSNAYTDREK